MSKRITRAQRRRRQTRIEARNETIATIVFLVVAAVFLGGVIWMTAVRLESLGCTLTSCPIESLRH